MPQLGSLGADLRDLSATLPLKGLAMTSSLDDRARGARVVVTGATGYVAGWLVKRLLEAGATVHATVRDPSDANKVVHLKSMARKAPGELSLHKADLLRPGSYDAAAEGCAVVFHTASPFIAADKITDPERDLIAPALKGTRNVLDTVNRTPSVTRVVLTSSLAAMFGGPADTGDSVITETSWNTISSLETAPYPYSKVLAERAAWDMANAQRRWRLVVVNPGLVVGPGTADVQTSASFDHIRRMVDGTYRKGMPPLYIGMVDVRDVAEAHFRAAFMPGAQGRHLNVLKSYYIGRLADVLKVETEGRYQLPQDTRPPESLRHRPTDNTKSKVELGLEYRPIEPGILAMFQQLERTGQISPLPLGEG